MTNIRMAIELVKTWVVMWEYLLNYPDTLLRTRRDVRLGLLTHVMKTLPAQEKEIFVRYLREQIGLQ